MIFIVYRYKNIYQYSIVLYYWVIDEPPTDQTSFSRKNLCGLVRTLPIFETRVGKNEAICENEHGTYAKECSRRVY